MSKSDKKELSGAAQWIKTRLEIGPVTIFAIRVGVAKIVGLWDDVQECFKDEALLREIVEVATGELVSAGLALWRGRELYRPGVKRWDFTKGAHVTHPEVDAFLGAILGVCRAHNMSLESADMSLLLVQRLDAKYCCALDEAAVYLAAPEKEEKTS